MAVREPCLDLCASRSERHVWGESAAVEGTLASPPFWSQFRSRTSLCAGSSLPGRSFVDDPASHGQMQWTGLRRRLLWSLERGPSSLSHMVSLD